jgi:hypothetical protein
MEISGNENLVSLNGLENITFIDGSLILVEMSDLVNLSGLNNLACLNGSMKIGYLQHNEGLWYIVGNPLLTSVPDFTSLDSIGGDFYLMGNEMLTNVDGLSSLKSIGGDLLVYGNAILEDFVGLNNLISIGGDMDIGSFEGNPGFQTLEGLNNIQPESIELLKICNNSSLSSCAVQSICQYLAAPNGEIIIEYNAPGCNSPEEVDSACVYVSVEQSSVVSRQSSVRVYPNPTTGISSFWFRGSPARTTDIVQSGGSSKEHVTLKIYDLHGREVATVVDERFPPGEHIVSFDASSLTPGVYILRQSAVGSRQLAARKFIVIK